MLNSEITYLLLEPFKTIAYHDLVSLTLESYCRNGVELSAILTMSMWLQLNAGKPV